MKVKVARSCPTLRDPLDYTVHGILQARILEWVAFPFSRGYSRGLLHCRLILYQLNHKGSPRILEWVAYPFSSESSWPRNPSRVSCIAGRFFNNWAIRECNTRLPCPSLTPRACSNSDPSSWWCHPKISSSVVPFSSCLQSFPASGSFQMSQFFTLGGQNIGVSASTLVLPMNIQDWFPLGWTSWISLQSKGLSRVFSNTTVQKHQFFSAQLSL